MRIVFKTLVLAVTLAATPALAVTNLIKNGSFEQGGAGTGGFLFWTKTNTPDGVPRQDQAASVINYNSTASYPMGAYGEAVTPDNAPSMSPDAIGTKAAYFVGDFSSNETISQLTYLIPGNYRVGFSYYLPQNGLNNPGNVTFDARILGMNVASTVIDNSSIAKTWFYATGVAQIVSSGWYDTSFVFNSNRKPSKDIVIDRVFATSTRDPFTVIIPPSHIPSVPEPDTWAMLLIGFGAVGFAARRRRNTIVVA
jgi:hypothetical protein